MANHKSALKRARQNQIRRMRNRAVKTRVKNVVKEIRQTAAAGTPAEAAEQLNRVKATIAKAAKRGVIHRNTAARKISRLSHLVNRLSA